jgi:signal peptidase I
MTPVPASRIVALAFGVALVLCGLMLVAAFWNPVSCLPLALLFLVVAIGIRRRVAWRAFGGALILAAMGTTVTIGMLRNGTTGQPLTNLAVLWLLIAGTGLVLYRAGRAMAGSARHGSPAAWVALAAAVLLIPQILQPYVMATGSMKNTVTPGDYLLVCPVAGSAITRGEVVQMRYPIDRKQIWIKRVVAVGGDRVRFHDKVLILNGSPVQEPYAIHSSSYMDPFRDNFPATPNSPLVGDWAAYLEHNVVNGELLVPEGKFFVLGDNRDDSLDSRYFGFVDRADIIGKPVLTYGSFLRGGHLFRAL